MPFYAVKVGRQTGIYDTWPECEAQVRGFQRPVYRKFATRDAAEDFVRAGGSGSSGSGSGSGGSDPKEIGAAQCASGPFYAVREGFQRGIYKTWAECQKQVSGFKCAKFKKFNSNEDALEFLGLSVPTKTSRDIKGNPGLDSPKASSKPSEGPARKATSKPTVSSGGESSRSSRPSFMKNSTAPGAAKVEPKAKDLKRKSSSNGERKTKVLKIEDLPSNFEPLDIRGPDRVVYTDGGCFNNGRRGARAGYGVWWGRDHPWNEGRRLAGEQTNNRAEIEAAIAAITKAKEEGIERLEIRTDSKFLIDCITKWVKGWRKNGWKLRDGGEVKVKEAVERLDDLLASCSTKVVWVSELLPQLGGHVGYRFPQTRISRRTKVFLSIALTILRTDIRKVMAKRHRLVILKVALPEDIQTHVRGHSGIVGNEAADRLARWGAFDSDSSFENSL